MRHPFQNAPHKQGNIQRSTFNFEHPRKDGNSVPLCGIECFFFQKSILICVHLSRNTGRTVPASNCWKKTAASGVEAARFINP
jgi:hypothetical protein